jgi:recombination protein RecA
LEKGSVMRLGDAGATYEVDTIPTGSLGLDIALGVGGIPRGRVIEIFGPESSGKTTLTLAIIARRKARRHRGVRRRRARARSGLCGKARRQGQRSAGLAARHRRAGARNHRHAGALRGVDVVVVDSVAALTPKAEIEGEMGDQHMGCRRA